jgi:hypothetical protein
MNIGSPTDQIIVRALRPAAKAGRSLFQNLPKIDFHVPIRSPGLK